MEKKKALTIGVVLVVVSILVLIAIALSSGLGSELMGLGGIGTALGLGFLAQAGNSSSGRQRDEEFDSLADRREELQGDLEDGNQRAQDGVDSGLERVERIEAELERSEDNSGSINDLLRSAITRARERENS